MELKCTEAQEKNFLDTPLAELEKQGVSVRLIGSLEKQFGLYVRDLIGVDDKAILSLPNVGKTELKHLKRGLSELLRRS